MHFERIGTRQVLALVACAFLVARADAQCSAADAFEDDDDCASASVIAPGTITGLTCQGPGSAGGDDRDFFRVSVPAGEMITVEVFHEWSTVGDLDGYLYDATDANCGDKTSFLDSGFTSTNNETMSYLNSTGSSQDVIVEVSAWTGGSTDVDCNEYDLAVTVGPDPCAAPTDDSFEENDVCGSGAALGTGVQSGLLATDTDPDHYEITVGAAEILTIDALYGTENADVDLTLYDDTACTTELDSEAGFEGGSTVTWTNDTGSAATLTLLAEIDASSGTCNAYTLNVATIPDICQVGPDDSFEENDACGAAAALPTGATTGLYATELDGDYYTFTVPAGNLVTVDVTYPGTTPVDLELYDDLACTNEVDSVLSFGGSGQVEWANTTGGSVTMVLHALIPFGDCNVYDLGVTIAPDPCQAVGVDDSFEENDDCASAVALPSGSTTGLYARDGDDDYYTISVPAGQLVTVDLSYSGSVPVDMELFDDLACTNEVDSFLGSGGSGQVQWGNATGATATAVLRATIPLAAECNSYDLNVSFAPDPCLDPLADDSFEDNDDCGSAIPMTDGLTTGLFVSKYDHDFFSVQVADGDMLVVDVFNDVDNGDVDLYLYDDTPGDCGDIENGWIDRGFTGSDNEQVETTNTSGSTATYYVQVVLWAGDNLDCNDDYDLQITGSAGEASMPFCAGDGSADAGGGPVGCPCGNDSALGAEEGCESSLGFGAILTTTGTNLVANDDLAFHVTQARASQPSLLVQGASRVATPFKDGVLCTGTPTERVEVVFLDASGSGSTVSSIVTNGNVSPGDTRYYQQWYRDPGGVSPCGTGSNFTGGRIVSWL